MTQHEALTVLEKLKADRRAEVRLAEEARAAAELAATERTRRELKDAVTRLLGGTPGGEALLDFVADWGQGEYTRESRLSYRKVTFRVPGHADVVLYLTHRNGVVPEWVLTSAVDDEWPTWGVDDRGGFDALADALIAAEASGDPPF